MIQSDVSDICHFGYSTPCRIRYHIKGMTLVGICCLERSIKIKGADDAYLSDYPSTLPERARVHIMDSSISVRWRASCSLSYIAHVTILSLVRIGYEYYLVMINVSLNLWFHRMFAARIGFIALII